MVAAAIGLGLAEEKAAVREEMFLRPWVEFIKEDGILNVTPLFKSRSIQQPA